jgi:hypothetical protein
MNTMTSHNIRSNRTPLTLEQVRSAAPSAFATTPYHPAVSDKYVFLPTSDAITALMSAGFQLFAASQSRTRLADKQEFTKHMLRFRAPDTVAAVGDVFPEVVLINSHVGSSAWKLMAGLFRMICSNGMVVADSLVASISVPHKGRNAIEAVATGSLELVKRMPETIDAIARWKAIHLDIGEQVAYANAAHVLRFGDSEGKVESHIRPTQLLNVRREEDAKSDLFTVYNRVQENMIKGGLHPATRGRRATRAVTGIDQDVKLNRALWTLTEQMATLKG